MFRLHFLSINAIFKVRQIMNKVFNGREKSRRYLSKDRSFNIQTWVNQLYLFLQTVLEDLKL